MLFWGIRPIPRAVIFMCLLYFLNDQLMSATFQGTLCMACGAVGFSDKQWQYTIMRYKIQCSVNLFSMLKTLWGWVSKFLKTNSIFFFFFFFFFCRRTWLVEHKESETASLRSANLSGRLHQRALVRLPWKVRRDVVVVANVAGGRFQHGGAVAVCATVWRG